jgi:hypothetical protein
MGKNQQCKNCKKHFANNSPQKNYLLYATYGFENEEKFKNHNSKNKNCPYNKIDLFENSSINHEIISNHEVYIPEVEWGPFIPKISIDLDDYVDDQEIIQKRLEKHKRGGKPLWFNTSEEAALTILAQLLNEETQFVTLVAEPGSGKTAVIHCLIYRMLMLPYERAIHPNCITITTGMSDKEWYDQIMDNFKLRDGSYLWDSIYNIKETFSIVHRSNFHKRISWLLNNLEYISNSIFIIDEHHIADEIDMTIDNEFKRLGLTEDKLKAYNIKIINVSATPDVSLSLMSRRDNHKMVVLQNGEKYKGFGYYVNQNMIKDYNNDVSIDNLIRKTYSTPRYHYIRARTQQEKGEYRESIINICKKNDWDVIEDDSDNNYYLSFEQDERERQSEIDGKSIIRTYLQPLKHRIILLKSKYPASKRLKLTKYTGLIAEKPSEKMNTTITCNGLIPRFWGHYELPEFLHNQKPIFLCNKKSVDEYIKFTIDFIYNGKSYTSNRIKSDENKLKEFTTTWCAELAKSVPISQDTKISISNGQNGERNYFDSVDEIGVFLRSKGFSNVRDVNEFNKGPNGYIFPRRSPDHNSEDKRLIRRVYEEKFVKNGGGTHINRQWSTGGSGQPYMIWPVYETLESLPEDVKYYVHYLKI